MLGREAVDQRRCLVEGAEHDDRAVAAPARAGDLGARELCQVCRHGVFHPRREGRVVGHQDRLGIAVMLCLGGRSAAIQPGSLALSATTRISEGPAIMSIPTVPKTSRLAAAT